MHDSRHASSALSNCHHHFDRKVVEIIRAQEQSRDLHEQFHHQLERAPDGFSVVADYFGRGVFNKVSSTTRAVLIGV